MSRPLRLVCHDTTVIRCAVDRTDRGADDSYHAIAKTKVHQIRSAPQDLVGHGILPGEIQGRSDAHLEAVLMEHLAHDRYRVAASVSRDRRHPDPNELVDDLRLLFKDLFG